MQQKEIGPDWRFLEDLAAAQGHHRRYISNPDLFNPWHYQQQSSWEQHDSRPYPHCRFHAAYSSFIRSYLQQHAPRRQKKVPAQSLRSQHTLCTSLSSCTPLHTSRGIVVPELLALQRPTKLRTRNRGCRAVSVRLRPSRLPWPLLPPMHRAVLSTDRSAQDIRAIVSNIVPPHAAISSVQLLPHHRLPQVYEVKLSDMTTILVVLPPLPILRLLRSEQNMAGSEAAVVQWLRDELVKPQGPADADVHSPRPPLQPITEEHPTQGPRLASHARKDRSGSASLPAVLRTDLLQYLPSPVALSSAQLSGASDQASSSPSLPSTSPPLSSFACSSSPPLTFNVFRPPSGVPIAALSAPLTAAERVSIDYQGGKLLRRLSRVTSRSGNFGPALAVLAPQSIVGSPQASDLAVSMGSWSVAFHSILESILRDGEDVAVALAYPTIRKHFRRLGHLLDSVTTPALVVVNAMDDSNLLVQRSPVIPHSTVAPEELGSGTATPSLIKQRSASPTSPAGEKDTAEAVLARSSPSPPFRASRSSSSPPFVESSADIVVTGLRDWSHCIFGDPLFAPVFCEQPSTSFLNGFNGAENDGEQDPHGLFTYHDEHENRAVRILLYQCYHAVVQIVRGFYRPGRDQTTQELAARKRLTEILAKLEAIDDDPKRRFRHRRPSGEMSPAKKPKSESRDDTPRR